MENIETFFFYWCNQSLPVLQVRVDGLDSFWSFWQTQENIFLIGLKMPFGPASIDQQGAWDVVSSLVSRASYGVSLIGLKNATTRGRTQLSPANTRVTLHDFGLREGASLSLLSPSNKKTRKYIKAAVWWDALPTMRLFTSCRTKKKTNE